MGTPDFLPIMFFIVTEFVTELQRHAVSRYFAIVYLHSSHSRRHQSHGSHTVRWAVPRSESAFRWDVSAFRANALQRQYCETWQDLHLPRKAKK